MIREGAHALYRFLARSLLPRSFRREYGDELEASVGARLTSKRGALGVMVATVVELWDLAWTAVREWWALGRERWVVGREGGMSGREWPMAERKWRMVATGGSSGDQRGRGGGRDIMGGMLKNLRIAARTLARRPGFALGVVLTLGLGIGATTTIYAVVDGVMLRPLPYEDPSALVAIGTLSPTSEWLDQEAGLQDLGQISAQNYRRFRDRTRSFEALAAIDQEVVMVLYEADATSMGILNCVPFAGS